MNKNIVIIIGISLMINGCESKAQGDPRKKVIKDFINAVIHNDTVTLYNLVDTSAYFDTQGKDIFLSGVNYLHESFERFGSRYADSTIKILRLNIPFTEYTYSFCRDDSDKITENTLEVVFRFADFDPRNKIHFFSIENAYPIHPSFIKALLTDSIPKGGENTPR